MRFLVPLIALPLLAACNVETKKPVEGDDNVSINAGEDGKVAFNFPFAKGEIDLPSGMMKDGEVDIDGVKLMPGSKLSGFSVFSENEVSTVTIGFTAPQKAADARTYFADQFAKHGGKASVEGNAVKAITSDGGNVLITVDDKDGGSKGTVVIKETDAS